MGSSDAYTNAFLSQFSSSGAFVKTVSITGAEAPYPSAYILDGSGNAWMIDTNAALHRISGGAVASTITLPSDVKELERAHPGGPNR